MLLPTKEYAVAAIRHSYAVLQQEKILSPENISVTHSLTHLVRTLTQCHAPDTSNYLLQTPNLCSEREHLPGLCGLAECEMEKYWARKLLTQKGTGLEEFWYHAEYCELCRAEISLLQGRTFERISFLGAGALPVTAFLLAKSLSKTQKVVCVDNDDEACDLSHQLAHKLDLGQQIDVRCQDARHYVPEENELVICASLLQGHNDVYKQLRAHSCNLMVRNAEGVYQFLYKPAILPTTGFCEIAKTEVDFRRINTTHYYEQERDVLADAD